jgi:hypothetical protein
MAVFAAALLLGATPTQATETPAASVEDDCPTYATLLRSALARLERGDRAGAITQIKRARTALADCLRDSAEETALAALK